MLLVAGTAIAAAVAGPAAAQAPEIHGTIEYEGGAKIPKGDIEIYIEDPAVQGHAQPRAAATQVKSNGGSKSMEFSLALPARSTASPTRQIVARLLREDGWLLARGSTQFEVGTPVHITLFTAMY
jgi:hypothetical protein